MRAASWFFAVSLVCGTSIAQPASAADVIAYTFAGNGIGCRGDCGTVKWAQVERSAGWTGRFVLDPSQVTVNGDGSSSYSFSGQDDFMGFTTLMATSIGNTLSFSYSAVNPGGRYVYTTSLTFAPGALSVAFPSNFSFSDVTASTFTAETRQSFVSGGVYESFTGSVLFANASPLNLTRARFGDTEIGAAVPEPSTWALMLLGFGAVGYSFRQRRRVAALAT